MLNYFQLLYEYFLPYIIYDYLWLFSITFGYFWLFHPKLLLVILTYFTLSYFQLL